MPLLAVVFTIASASLAMFVAAASASKPHATTTCPYNEYTQYAQYHQYCASGTTPPSGSGTSNNQTISPGVTSGAGANAAGVTVNTSYPNASTLVNVNLPAGTTARLFYLYTTLGTSFGVDHNYATLHKDILAYNGSTNVPYTITKLSRPHGRIHLTLHSLVATPTFKINKNVFEFTSHERRIIQKDHITKTLVSLEVTTSTGQVYTVRFRALFGALVVVRFH